MPATMALSSQRERLQMVVDTPDDGVASAASETTWGEGDNNNVNNDTDSNTDNNS